MSRNVTQRRLIKVDYDIVENISNPVVVTNSGGEIVFLNAAARNAPQLNNPPIQIGEMVIESIQGQWKPFLKNIVQSVADEDVPASFEAEYTVEGKKTFYDVVCCPLHHDMNVDRLMFEFKDITLQKVHEDKSRSTAHDLANFTATANAVVIGIDVKGFIVEWNDCAAQLTGYHQADALARHFTELIGNDDGRDVLMRIMTEVLEGNTIANRELPIVSRDLLKRNFMVKATPRKNDDMEVIGILIVGLDITELTEFKHLLENKIHERMDVLKKENELLDVEKAFVSIASHEFRAPILAIKIQVKSLKKMDTGLSPDVVDRINRINDQAEHMSRLIDNVLIFGKGDTGTSPANIESIELRSFLETVISDVENTTHGSHRILFTFPEDVLYISSDKCILRSVFVNLLSNAIKFSPGRDKVYFHVVRRGPLVEFVVSDEGMGISDGDLGKIFQPFSRCSNADHIKGTGLGLSIVKKAVGVLNGQVWVESKLNVGTKFTVQLKL